MLKQIINIMIYFALMYYEIIILKYILTFSISLNVATLELK